MRNCISIGIYISSCITSIIFEKKERRNCAFILHPESNGSLPRTVLRISCVCNVLAYFLLQAIARNSVIFVSSFVAQTFPLFAKRTGVIHYRHIVCVYVAMYPYRLSTQRDIIIRYFRYTKKSSRSSSRGRNDERELSSGRTFVPLPNDRLWQSSRVYRMSSIWFLLYNADFTRALCDARYTSSIK